MKNLILATSFIILGSIALAQEPLKVERYDNGKLKAEYYSQADDVVNAKFYFSSGQLMEEGTFKDDLRDGKWSSYSRAGKVTAIGYYTNGEKSGLWQFWNLSGDLSHEVDYSGEKPSMMVYNQKD